MTKIATSFFAVMLTASAPAFAQSTGPAEIKQPGPARMTTPGTTGAPVVKPGGIDKRWSRLYWNRGVWCRRRGKPFE